MSIVNDIVQSIKNFKKNKTISEIKSSNKKNIDIKNDINNIENEKVSPTIAELEAIAKALNMKITDLFDSDYK